MHFDFDSLEQPVDYGSVQEPVQFDEPVTLELSLLLGGNAKLMIEGMSAHTLILLPVLHAFSQECTLTL